MRIGKDSKGKGGKMVWMEGWFCKWLDGVMDGG